MTKEEKIQELERMFKNCPEILTPIKASRFAPIGKNGIYELIKRNELRAFNYRGSYLIAKADLIEYLADHSDDESPKRFSKPCERSIPKSSPLTTSVAFCILASERRPGYSQTAISSVKTMERKLGSIPSTSKIYLNT